MGGVPHAGDWRPAQFARPGGVIAIVVLNVAFGGLYILAGLGLALAAREGGIGPAIAAGLAILLGLVFLVAAVGLFQLAPWGRQLQIGASILGLLGFPCGTLLYGVVLYYLTRPAQELVFSGRAPAELSEGEWALVGPSSGGSSMLVVVAAAALAVLAVPMIGIVAAIAIPSFLRARVSANESAAIGSVRTIISAQAAYQSANSGFYDKLECLVNPQSCIPGYPATGPRFLEPVMLTSPRTGYKMTFHPGPPPEERPGAASPSSITSWAVVLEPVTRNTTGVRSFCGDASGRVCATTGTPIEPLDGACPEECLSLR